MITRWGGFLERIDHFDAAFFGVSPREANAADPQQRLLLEVAWEALEDAGQVPERLAGSQTGVFVGLITDDYWDLQARDPESIDLYATAGNHRSIVSGRLSHVLGFQGPSFTVDTACSSSLTAIHLAVQSLRSGESTLALAGGVNLVLQPEASLGFSHARMLSPDGRCKFADASGNGFVRSDGIAMVVLKPLADALRDRDPIYAVIRGSALNNDGQTSPLMSPSRPGQEAVLRLACRDAGVDPADVGYVEAHGTGTPAGDPIELSALATVLGEGRPADRPLIVGSVKSNIGHTEGAAGVAGLIKAALCLRHGAIPRVLHLQRPNPVLAGLPLVVPTENLPWPAGAAQRLAGVSSFGISCTNAHVVLEEAPEPEPAAPDEPADMTEAGPYLLPLSARSPEALRAMAHRWQEFLRAPGDPGNSLRDVCWTASVRRSHHEHRLGLVAYGREEMADQLAAFLAGEARAGCFTGSPDPGSRPRVVFVFPGQGSQWLGMGRELWATEPVFRQALESCAAEIAKEAGWSLLDVLLGDLGKSALEEVDVIQPTLFALGVSLAELWRSWGVEPAAVVGQSMGEVAAACVAGALSLQDAVRVICRRSALVRSSATGGAMAVVDLPLAEAELALAGYEDRLSVAVSSSPRSTVLSGDAAAMDRVLAGLEERGVFCRRVKVDYASHSPYMDPLRAELLGQLAELRPRASEVPLFSTVTGGFRDGAELDAGYWWNNLRQPVLFSAAVARLAEEGHDLFLEVSPHPLLLTPIQQTLRHLGREGGALPSLRREEPERMEMLFTLAALHVQGCPVAWERLYPSPASCVKLPAYPWQRERFWLAERQSGPARATRRAGDGHPLLGERVWSPVQPGTHLWDAELGTDLFPYFQGHQVQGTVVLPGAAYVEMALAAAAELGRAAGEPGPCALERVSFREVFFLPPGEVRRLHLAVSRQAGELRFQFLRPEAGAEWPVHCSGALRLAAEALAEIKVEDGGAGLLEAVRSRATRTLSAADHYQALEARGIHDEAEFMAVEELWTGPGEALARLRPMPAGAAGDSGGYQIHPALLDACFQAVIGVLPDGELSAAAYLPVSIESLVFLRQPTAGMELWSHAVARAVGGESVEVDLRVLDAAGAPVLEARGFRFQRLGAGQAPGQAITGWFLQAQWQLQPRSQEAPASRAAGPWLVLADEGGFGPRLAAGLEAAGERCVTVPASAADPGLQLAGQPPFRGVIYLGGLDAPVPEALTPAVLDEVRERIHFGAVRLVQALVQAAGAGAPAPRLWLVTRGAQVLPEDGGRAAAGLAQSPLWGLGRVLFYENPELRCVRVDLGADDGPEGLLVELAGNGREDEVALRGGARYVHRLARRPPSALAVPERPSQAKESMGAELAELLAALGHRPGEIRSFSAAELAAAFGALAEARPAARLSLSLGETGADLAAAGAATGGVREDGTYLLTGGLGALGLTVARWLVERGARHLILLGRSGPSPEARQVLADLAAAGARVVTAQADVADADALAAALARAGEGLPPLRGVVHSAGLLDDGLVAQMEAERFRRVMAPKVQGAWNLHMLTASEPLDFFWLFSSIAALIGSPGQGNYVAANEFLDVLALYRRSRGLPALSIGWGPWSEVGLAARPDRGGRLAERGLDSMTPEQGVAALDRLLGIPGAGAARVAVAPFDPRRWCEFYPAARELPLLEPLLAGVAGAADAAGGGGLQAGGESVGRPTREQLLPLLPRERQELLEADLAEQVARVLRLPAARIDPRQPIKRFGLDSLMAVELKSRVEMDFGVSVPLMRFLQGLNVADLAGEILDAWIPDDDEPQVAAAGQTQDAALLLERIDELSDEEVEALLRDLSTGEEMVR